MIIEKSEMHTMKKYKYLYLIIFLILIILILTKGISKEIVLNYFNDADKGIKDGFAGHNVIYIYNVIIMLLLLSISCIMTFTKKNKMKWKSILLLAIIMMILFIPVGRQCYSGGIAGITGQKYLYPIDILRFFTD